MPVDTRVELLKALKRIKHAIEYEARQQHSYERVYNLLLLIRTRNHIQSILEILAC